MMPKSILNSIVKGTTLAGALALPLASMANDATGFPNVPALADDGGGPDAMLFLAQSTNGNGNGRGERGSMSGHERPDAATGYATPTYVAPDASGISSSGTETIVALLSGGKDFCQKLQNPAYNVDCLSYQFWLTAQSMPKTGGYGDARTALLDAATRLHDLALANRDTSKPVGRAKVGAKQTSRPLTPVTNLAAVNAEAASIVRDTNLVLLRSSSESDQRRLAYVQIAAVVDSTKVLLRSS